MGFTEEQARCEAKRCLRCFANILLDTDSCVLCALCSDVCPLDLISLVPAAEVSAGATGTALLLLLLCLGVFWGLERLVGGGRDA